MYSRHQVPSAVRRNAGYIVAVILSGGLCCLCFPPYGIWPLALIAWAPLLWVTGRATSRQAFYLGLTQGIVAYGLSLGWLISIFGLAALVLYVIIALYVAVFCLLINTLCPKIANPYARATYISVVWMALEYYRCEWFYLRFPWITPGVALGPTWLTPIVGVYGVSLILFAATCLYMNPATRKPGFCVAMALLACGIWRPAPLAPAPSRTVQVLAVQQEEGAVDDYIAATPTNGSLPDIVIWPEYAVALDIRRDAPDDYHNICSLAAKLNRVLVFGAKTSIDRDGARWRNTAIALDGDRLAGEYYKNRPVHFFDDGVPGTTQQPIDTRLGKLGVSICFDNDYEYVDRRLTAHGAQVLIAPTFDARQWTAAQHLQHAALFRLRAAENGRWLVSAASSGVSQIVDPHGCVHAALPAMRTGVLRGAVGLEDGCTVYTRVGWLIPWICIAASCIWSLALWRCKTPNIDVL